MTLRTGGRGATGSSSTQKLSFKRLLGLGSAIRTATKAKDFSKGGKKNKLIMQCPLALPNAGGADSIGEKGANFPMLEQKTNAERGTNIPPSVIGSFIECFEPHAVQATSEKDSQRLLAHPDWSTKKAAGITKRAPKHNSVKTIRAWILLNTTHSTRQLKGE